MRTAQIHRHEPTGYPYQALSLLSPVSKPYETENKPQKQAIITDWALYPSEITYRICRPIFCVSAYFLR
jgi:hypothetical protein